MVKPRKSRSKAGRRKSTKNDLLAMMQAKAVDVAADYVRRGRAHRGLTDADLVAAWVAAFGAYSLDPDPARPPRSALNDFEAELNLRQIDPPFDAVREDLERLSAAAMHVFEQLKAAPDQHAEFERDLQLDLISFKARRDLRKN
jgi:hypothetical protein